MAAPWDPANLDTNYSFGRPFVDKPSFDGLPLDSINFSQASLFAADRAAADWERVELLFERNWFGPCACLGSMWSLEDPGDLPTFDADPMDSGSLVDLDPQPISAAIPEGSLLRFFRARHTQPVDKPQSLSQPKSNGTTGQAMLYGAAAAPIQEPGFASGTAQESSPQKAVPVPKRMAGSAKENGGDGPLPPAIAIDPSEGPVPRAAEPVAAQTITFSRATTEVFEQDQLVPQLGTWADRQYRLLDPVPERGEFGPGSNSGNSIPSSASNNRSPNTFTNGVKANGMGTTVCGSTRSGDHGDSSSSRISPQGHIASPSPSDPSHKLLRQDQQVHSSYELQIGRGPGHEDVDRDATGPLQNGRYASYAVNGGLQALDRDPGQLQRTVPIDTDGRQVDTEALIQEAAWRWRFTRRWQAEQARTDPDQASSASRDQMEEALAYLQATNATTTVSMQIANVPSRGGGSGSRGGMSMDGSLMLTGTMGTLGAAASTLGGDWPLGTCGSGSGSFTSGPRILGRQASGEILAASREVASLNRRAAAVLQQQMDCELEAERRVHESLGQGPPWVGHFIPIVQIDEWGSFRFLMLKLRDQIGRGGVAPGSERQRILIRGHNYGSEGQLMEECNREILALAQKHNLPFEAPTCMGGGVMEWRRDRDRHLHLHSGFVMDRALPLAAGAGIPPNGNRPASAMDLLNLTAALARQSFPPTYKVTVLT